MRVQRVSGARGRPLSGPRLGAAFRGRARPNSPGSHLRVLRGSGKPKKRRKKAPQPAAAEIGRYREDLRAALNHQVPIILVNSDELALNPDSIFNRLGALSALQLGTGYKGLSGNERQKGIPERRYIALAQAWQEYLEDLIPLRSAQYWSECEAIAAREMLLECKNPLDSALLELKREFAAHVYDFDLRLLVAVCQARVCEAVRKLLKHGIAYQKIEIYHREERALDRLQVAPKGAKFVDGGESLAASNLYIDRFERHDETRMVYKDYMGALTRLLSLHRENPLENDRACGTRLNYAQRDLVRAADRLVLQANKNLPDEEERILLPGKNLALLDDPYTRFLPPGRLGPFGKRLRELLTLRVFYNYTLFGRSVGIQHDPNYPLLLRRAQLPADEAAWGNFWDNRRLFGQNSFRKWTDRRAKIGAWLTSGLFQSDWRKRTLAALRSAEGVSSDFVFRQRVYDKLRGSLGYSPMQQEFGPGAETRLRGFMADADGPVGHVIASDHTKVMDNVVLLGGLLGTPFDKICNGGPGKCRIVARRNWAQGLPGMRILGATMEQANLFGTVVIGDDETEAALPLRRLSRLIGEERITALIYPNGGRQPFTSWLNPQQMGGLHLLLPNATLITPGALLNVSDEMNGGEPIFVAGRTIHVDEIPGREKTDGIKPAAIIRNIDRYFDVRALRWHLWFEAFLIAMKWTKDSARPHGPFQPLFDKHVKVETAT